MYKIIPNSKAFQIGPQKNEYPLAQVLGCGISCC